MLSIVESLFEQLNRRDVRYCHWKSNAALDAALDGVGDLDLLVDPRHWPILLEILDGLAFIRVELPAARRSRPAAQHYYGFDGPTGRFVHLDLYDTLVTGGTLIKNHRLPLEEMVFENRRFLGSVAVPSPGAELLLLVLRKLLESASVLEHALLLREYDNVLGELHWLDDQNAREEARGLVRRWLPCIDADLWDRCQRAIRWRGAVVARAAVGRRLARRLRQYELAPAPEVGRERSKRLLLWVIARISRRPWGFLVGSRGAIIAFVGPEASGKSSLVADTEEWLNQVFLTRATHVGKPRSSWVTFLPNLALPFMRAALPGYRVSAVTRSSATEIERRNTVGSWLYRLRCVGLAYDRWCELNAAVQAARRGEIVVCDRFPSREIGFVDSPQLISEDQPRLGGLLARLEHRAYAAMPAADLVITCDVPLQEAVRRNATRHKVGGPEPEDYVRWRHAQFAGSLPAEFRLHVMDTTTPREETSRTVRQLVWHALVTRSRGSAEP